MIVSGGTLEIGRRILVGNNSGAATGSLTLSGTGVIDMKRTGSNAEGDLGMVRPGAGLVSINLDGGTFILSGMRFTEASAAQSTVRYNGTTLRANVNSSANGGGNFYNAPANAVHQLTAAGLVLDSNNFTMLMNAELHRCADGKRHGDQKRRGPRGAQRLQFLHRRHDDQSGHALDDRKFFGRRGREFRRLAHAGLQLRGRAHDLHAFAQCRLRFGTRIRRGQRQHHDHKSVRPHDRRDGAEPARSRYFDAVRDRPERIRFSSTRPASPGRPPSISIANALAGKSYTITDNPGASSIELTIGDSAISEWNVATGGSWATAGNWLGGTPNGISAVAKFGFAIGSASTVQLSGPKTVGGLILAAPKLTPSPDRTRSRSTTARRRR